MLPPPSSNIELTLCGAGALLIRVGLGWYASGTARSKNAAGAGWAVLHARGGAAALAAAIIVGPRTGKYNHDGSSNLIPGHSVPMASVGVILMLAGWVPYLLAATMLNRGLTSHTAGNILLA